MSNPNRDDLRHTVATRLLEAGVAFRTGTDGPSADCERRQATRCSGAFKATDASGRERRERTPPKSEETG
jgi:hypothetical protein